MFHKIKISSLAFIFVPAFMLVDCKSTDSTVTPTTTTTSYTGTGSITKGKLADIIAVQSNPLDDVTILEHVKFVMKEGTVYKNELGK